MPCREQPPPSLQGASGVGGGGGGGGIWPVDVTGTVVLLPSPFRDPVAIRNPSSPQAPGGAARTARRRGARRSPGSRSTPGVTGVRPGRWKAKEKPAGG